MFIYILFIFQLFQFVKNGAKNCVKKTNRLDIVKLIEKNPITRLSKDYQSSLITKAKAKFNDPEQQLFVASFYCYLNYNSNKYFIIVFDDIWKWVGFS